MPVVLGSIPHLINGVSPHPAPIRLPSQCEEQINGYFSVRESLKKRPPLEFVAKRNSLQLGSAFIHTINQDSAERYVPPCDVDGPIAEE